MDGIPSVSDAVGMTLLIEREDCLSKINPINEGRELGDLVLIPPSILMETFTKSVIPDMGIRRDMNMDVGSFWERDSGQTSILKQNSGNSKVTR